MITSSDNPAVKEVRRLQSNHARGRSSLFVAEGEDLASMASGCGWTAVHALVREGSGLDGEEVEAGLLDSISSLGSGTRIISVFEKRFASIIDAGLIVHLDGLSDPGNVGTIVRSAHAFGATGVSIGPGTVDPFNPKAVRASMGSIFAMPIIDGVDVAQLPGFKVGLDGTVDSSGVLPSGDLVLVVGAERAGLSDETLAKCDTRWSIAMPGGAESLNAAVACSIAMHSVNRIPPR